MKLESMCRIVIGGLAVLLAVLPLAAQPREPSWHQWRGPTRDGLAVFAAPKTWPERPTKRWEVSVGLGHASPVVADGRVVVHTRRGERETVSAFDLESGKQIWQDAYDAPYRMNPAARAHGPGPKSTPLIIDGRVFTLGIGGVLSAYDAGSGRRLWRTDPPATLPLYGTAMSPAAEGARVIAHVGGHDNGALTAFDGATGRVLWRWGGDGPGYASPVVADIHGTRQIVTQTQKFLVGIAATDGRLLWRVPFQTSHDQNAITPLVLGDIIIYSGLDHGTTAVRVLQQNGTWTTAPVWRNEQVSMYMSTPSASDVAIFGLAHRNSGQFVALDRATGKTLWTTQGREGTNASIVRAGSWLLLFTTNAEMIVTRASATAYGEVRRYTIADSAVWAHPAVVRDRIVVKDVDMLTVWSF
jgi:outer membrane protein assembly factor BamB